MMNVNGLMNAINQLHGNPQQLLQRFNIPSNCNTPQDVMQYLMNNNMVSQSQINQANSLYKQIFRR